MQSKRIRIPLEDADCVFAPISEKRFLRAWKSELYRTDWANHRMIRAVKNPISLITQVNHWYCFFKILAFNLTTNAFRRSPTNVDFGASTYRQEWAPRIRIFALNFKASKSQKVDLKWFMFGVGLRAYLIMITISLFMCERLKLAKYVERSASLPDHFYAVNCIVG